MDQIVRALEGANRETSSMSVTDSWNILKYISNEGDKKRLRQVCRNWRLVIDRVLGLELKLNDKNFELVFVSYLLQRCSSLVVYESAGLKSWHYCPFSETQLQIVEIRGGVLVDNWKLLLTTCKMIKTLIIQLQEKPKKYNVISEWNSWVETPQLEIGLNELLRLFIKGLMTHCDFHYSTLVNLLKTIKTPKLKQFVCEVWIDDLCHQQPIFPSFSQFQNSVVDLKQNSPELKSFGWVSAISEYRKNQFWDSLFKREKNALIIHSSHSFWIPIANLFLAGNSLEEIHYDFGTLTDARNAFQIMNETATVQSENVERISLGIQTFMAYQSVDLRSLQLFSHLRELRISWILGLHKEISLKDSSFQFIFLMLPATLEKIFISSVPVSLQDLNIILDCPQIKEINIRNQSAKFSQKLSAALVEKTLNHKTLKWITVDLSSRSKIEELKSFSHFIGDLRGKWIYGVEWKLDFNRCFYCVNTSVTRENILGKAVEGSFIATQDIPHGFAIILAENVTEPELQNMKLRYTLSSSLEYLLGQLLRDL